MSAVREHAKHLVECSMKLEASNEQLVDMAREVEAEKAKSEQLLREVLPATVARQLLDGTYIDARELLQPCVWKRGPLIPGEYGMATVMFADCPLFQQVVPLCQPRQLVDILNDLFTRFDRLVQLHGVSGFFTTYRLVGRSRAEYHTY